MHAALWTFLGKYLGGVRPTDRLTVNEVQSLEPAVHNAKRRVQWTLGIVGLVSVAALTILLARARLSSEPDSVAPVLIDERERWAWMGMGVTSMMLVLMPLAVIEFLWTRARLGEFSQKYSSYWATQKHWRPIREYIFMFVLLLPMTSFIGLGSWHMGDVVDATGYTRPVGIWGREHIPMQRVSSVCVYQKLKAPIGVIDRQTVRLTLDNGTHVDIDPRKRPVSAMQIAQHFAAARGLDVQHDTLRP